MGLFNKSKDDSNAFIRKGEEAYYHQALTELESGKVNKGVYAKALAESSGDDAITQSLYLKYRVQSISDEGAIEVLKVKEKKRIQEENAKMDWIGYAQIIGVVLFVILLIKIS